MLDNKYSCTPHPEGKYVVYNFQHDFIVANFEELHVICTIDNNKVSNDYSCDYVNEMITKKRTYNAENEKNKVRIFAIDLAEPRSHAGWTYNPITFETPKTIQTTTLCNGDAVTVSKHNNIVKSRMTQEFNDVMTMHIPDKSVNVVFKMKNSNNVHIFPL